MVMYNGPSAVRGALGSARTVAALRTPYQGRRLVLGHPGQYPRVRER